LPASSWGCLNKLRNEGQFLFLENNRLLLSMYQFFFSDLALFFIDLKKIKNNYSIKLFFSIECSIFVPANLDFSKEKRIRQKALNYYLKLFY